MQHVGILVLSPVPHNPTTPPAIELAPPAGEAWSLNPLACQRSSYSDVIIIHILQIRNLG